jgi:hypothetical protein
MRADESSPDQTHADSFHAFTIPRIISASASNDLLESGREFARMLLPQFALLVLLTAAQSAPPAGFTSLFNGRDLSGWRGRQQDYSPYEEATLSKDARAAKQVAWNADRDQHWRVDPAAHEIVSDGHGVFLATDKDYADFELFVDWKIVARNGDSGVYLRGFPQVQVWDPDNPGDVNNGAPRGSGALWNDNADNPGKWPLVKADNPIGEWNSFRIRMVGNRVWVWLNGKQTVDGQVLDNYFDRAKPVLPSGPIELQTHGSEIRFRNIYIRDIREGGGQP